MEFLLKPYTLLGVRTFKWIFCLIGPVLSFFYVLAVKPYGFSWFDTDEQIQLAIYYSLPVIGIWVIHLFLLQPLIVKKLNILNTFIWLAWIHFVISMYIYSFSEVYIFGSQFDWYFLPDTLKMVFQMGAAVTLIIVVIHLGYLIRQRLQADSN